VSQKSVLLDRLQHGPVCSYVFYQENGMTHRLAARVWDLKADGYDITSRRCDLHSHESGAVLYELHENGTLF
jgi:Helix-turn-helix domain